MAEEDDALEPKLAHARREASDLRALLDALPLATGVKDRDGRWLYINAAGSAGYGLAPSAMIGESEREVLPSGNDAEGLLRADREVIDSGRSLTVPGQRFQTHEGRTMVLHMTREPVAFQGTPAVLVTAWDVTDSSAAIAERRQLERRLAEAQRIEGLGLLAGGIAHDFNNLLVGVLGNADLAALEVAAGSRVEHFLGRIRTAAQRLADLAHQMLTYAGRNPTAIQAVDLGTVAREMLELMASSVPAHIEVTLTLPEALPDVAGDPAQLGQVIVNLLMNAAEAIGAAAGSIRVALRREFLDSVRTASLTVRSLRGATDCLCLEVWDDGPGMDEATRARIFDPFFSTKGKHGRGLGLASVIGIVRAHQGALQVDSSPGEGARIRIWLPLAEELVRVQPSKLPPASTALPSGGRVLIIDDESVVRETAAAILEAQGLTVLASADAATALDAARNAGRIDVVLLDLSIPGSSSEATHQSLRELLPDASIVLISGYSEPSVLLALSADPRTRFLQKPFSADSLSSLVGSLLG
jgi:two-component system, cell cycle sensor histidine kinase and response regulator CckA